MRLVTTAVAAAALLAAQLVWVVPGSAGAPQSFTPGVGTVVLQTSQTNVTSSTDHKLRVELTATHQVGYDSTTDRVAVTVFKGISGVAERHRWSFDVPNSAWDIDDSGAGTVKVPTTALSPYGKVKLDVVPVADPTTNSCNGSIRSQTQKVSVKGIFFFDTRSKGTHKWGSVGSNTKRFAFAATNTIVTTDDLPATPCVNPGSAPCVSEVVWSAASTTENLEGANTAGTRASFIATRNKELATPAHAMRTDELVARSKHLAIKNGAGGGATLAVTAISPATGSAKLTAPESSVFTLPCTKDGMDHTQTYTTWDGDYTNGSKPLAAHAQIFGPIKLHDVKGPGNASFSAATYE
jgi:hypothetical protein